MAMHGLLVRAGREAEALGHGWIGVDHFLLALLNPADDSTAARVLRESGLAHDAYAAELVAVVGREPGAASDGVSPNAAAYGMMGRAEGIAMGQGSRDVSPEHLLVAILSDPVTTSVELLKRSGTSLADIAQRLREAGVAVPAHVPPVEEEEVRRGERVIVPIDQLRALRAELPGLLPPGTRFGFNHDGRATGWFSASEGVDLPHYVEVALAAWDRGVVPCPCCRNLTMNRHQPRQERRCEVCGWTDALDRLGDGAALAGARRTYQRTGACREDLADQVRPPRQDEIPPWRTA